MSVELYNGMLKFDLWWCLEWELSIKSNSLFANHYRCIFILLLCRAIAFTKDMPQRFQIQLRHLVPALDSGNDIFQRCTIVDILVCPLTFRNFLKDRWKTKKIDTYTVFLLIYFLCLLVLSFPLYSLSLPGLQL